MKSSSHLYLSRLDHLRFLAALLVLVWHTTHAFVSTAYYPYWWAFPLSLLEEGHTGVSLFMVLSGYIFMAICRDREVAYGDFLRNRVLRIAPLFLFWLSLQLWTQPDADPLKVLGALATQTTSKGQMPNVGWTILVEFQFYLLFPFLLLFYRREGVRYLLGLIALAAVVRGLVALSGGSVTAVAYMSLFGRIDQFVLGMLACEAARLRPNLYRSGWLFAGSVIGWLIAFHVYNRLGGFNHFRGTGIWVVLPTLEGLAYATWTACYLSCPLTLPRWLDDGLAWLGKLSFSFYLNHLLVIAACVRVSRLVMRMPTTFEGALLFTLLIVLPAVTLVSALTYQFIELPFLTMRRSYVAAEPKPARLAA